MSGILGIWNTDGAPVREDLLRQMGQRLAHRGPDGSSHLTCGAAAFLCQHNRATLASVNEHQPFVAGNGIVVLLDGRLDNRDDLLQSMGPSALARNDSSDVELLAAAYSSFGDQVAARLEGDFAFAIYDPAVRRLLLARDAMGARVLYYARYNTHVLFASEIKAILAHPAASTGLHRATVAEILFNVWDYSDETNTLFTDIHRVPAACEIKVTPERTDLRRYFDFDPTRRLRLRNQAEYTAAYREAFTRAVHRRLRSPHPTAIMVSGGLDSSSIYCVARMTAREPAIPEPLGVALVFGEGEANEWDFQKAIQGHCGAELKRIPAKSFSASGDRAKKLWHTEGIWMMEDAYAEMYEQTRQAGARVMLSGLFGDNLLVSPQFLLDLVLQGRWPTAFRAWRGFIGRPWAYLNETSDNAAALRRFLWAEIRSFLIPEALRPMYRRLRYRDPERTANQTALKLLAPELRSHLQHQWRDGFVRCPAAPAHSKNLYLAARSKLLTYRIEMEVKAASAFGMDIAYPYRDRELVQLVMSMPGEMVYPDGDSRGIHRAAMVGVLPESVRLRRTKGDFTQVAQQGTSEDLASMADVRNGMATRLGLLAPLPQVEGVLRQHQESLPTGGMTKEMNDAVANLFAVEEFLAVFLAQNAACDTISPPETLRGDEHAKD